MLSIICITLATDLPIVPLSLSIYPYSYLSSSRSLHNYPSSSLFVSFSLPLSLSFFPSLYICVSIYLSIYLSLFLSLSLWLSLTHTLFSLLISVGETYLDLCLHGCRGKVSMHCRRSGDEVWWKREDDDKRIGEDCYKGDWVDYSILLSVRFLFHPKTFTIKCK